MNTSFGCRVRNRGTAMIVALILLAGMTIMAVTGFNLGLVDLKIAGNMQFRAEAETVAEQAIEQAISSTRFFKYPEQIYEQSCGGANTNYYCADVTGDRLDDVRVTLETPTCVVARTIPVSELKVDTKDGLSCVQGCNQNTGIEGVPMCDSLCGDTTWELVAQADALASDAQAVVTEGVAVWVPVSNMATQCKDP